jgi:hypothetical protein
MRRTQVLASSIIIRQDFRDAVRAVFFQTGVEGCEYATHGGTLFVVSYNGKVYGVTCRHVLQDFEWCQLVVTDQRFGTRAAGLKFVCYPSSPCDSAVGTDIEDLAVIEFADGFGPEFFVDKAYVIDAQTVRTSSIGDDLLVAGVLKAATEIERASINPQFCLLGFMAKARRAKTLRYDKRSASTKSRISTKWLVLAVRPSSTLPPMHCAAWSCGAGSTKISALSGTSTFLTSLN